MRATAMTKHSGGEQAEERTAREGRNGDCGFCLGTGVVDSGGFTPWDAPIQIACSCVRKTISGHAWVVFDGEEPVFIDANCTESEMRSWYRNQLSAGHTLRRIKYESITEFPAEPCTSEASSGVNESAGTTETV
jgi:hypothetical protein